MDDIDYRTEGDSEANNITTRAGLAITRRGFIAGTLATSVANFVEAAEPGFNIDTETDQVYFVPADAGLTAVDIVAVHISEKGPPTKVTLWRFEAAAFGPAARFDLPGPDFGRAEATGDISRTLTVRNVQYGALVGRSLSFTIERSSNIWTIGLTTDVWLNSNGENKPFFTERKQRRTLSQFQDGEALVEFLSTGRIPATLNKMFSGESFKSSSRAKLMSVAFSKTGEWTVRKAAPEDPSLILAAFDGKVSLASLTVAWEAEKQDGSATEGPTPSRRYLAAQSNLVSGTAQKDVLAVQPIEFGGGVYAPTVTIGAAALPSDAALHVRYQPPEYGAKAGCAIAWLGLSAASLGTAGPRPGVAFRTLPLVDLILAESRRGAEKPRIGLWGGAGVSREEPTQTLLSTPYGCLTVTRTPDFQQGAKQAVGPEAADRPGLHFGKLRAALAGDRTGFSDSTLWMLADGQTDRRQPQASMLHRLSIDLSLLEASAALPDVDFSRLAFDSADLRLEYSSGGAVPGLSTGELARPPANSYLWLGEPDKAAAPLLAVGEGYACRLDLSRACLDARRDIDLVSLSFRFAELSLVFDQPGAAPTIRPARPECRVIEAAGEIHDNRPVLAVDFAPQHVLEEAFFQLQPPPLPDVTLVSADLTGCPIEIEQQVCKDIQSIDPTNAWIVRQLASLEAEDASKRIAFRTWIRNLKATKDGKLTGPRPFGAMTFNMFATKFETAAARLAPEQMLYVGPYGMSADAVRIARELQTKEIAVLLADIANHILVEAKSLHGKLQAAKERDLARALEYEGRVEQQLPLYRLFRDAYVAEFAAGKGRGPSNEYIDDANLGWDPSVKPRSDPAVVDRAKRRLATQLSGSEAIDRLAWARLSGQSRLAFRINCGPSSGDSPENDGLNAAPVNGPRRPGSGGVIFPPGIGFTFEQLTDWSRHEPAVVRRAAKLYDAMASGVLRPVADHAANLDDTDVLAFQGFSKGQSITSAQRVSEIQASLRRRPTAFETAIELPARVVLSTAQDAVWQTDRPGVLPDFGESTAVTEDNAATDGSVDGTSRNAHLWSARLLAADVSPGVRVIDTPDLRPGALSARTDHCGLRLPGEAAPQRGPIAPWLIGAEQWDGGGLGSNAGPVCDNGTSEGSKSGLIAWLTKRLGIRTQLEEKDWRLFRTSLDARDRHELLLLSSGYGLPVRGKRTALDAEGEQAGVLTSGSEQFEPGEDFRLIDLDDTQAIYRPKALDVQELSLTALGGSMRHDTSFSPPAAALDAWGRGLYDALSIERWQHQIVLGRDIVATVVYSGFLFPTGHKASLTKLTERVFFGVPGEGIKAPLRQRMFIRISKPDKKFPAIGQPNKGRQWCAEKVNMLTTVTPDIIDPTMPSESAYGGPFAFEQMNGKLYLPNLPGLAFWPMTAMSKQARIFFQFSLDGATTAAPLLFVDTAAVENIESMAMITDHYNDAARSAERQLSMAGQEIRYAPSRNEGDTRLKTTAISLWAQGRRSESDDWQGNPTNFIRTAALGGADQPPFYPSVEFADVRLEHVEQLAGKELPPVRVRYDGHFVRYGFFEKGSTDPEKAGARENTAEVFLDVDVFRTGSENEVPAPELKMGSNGDRSGGVAHPDLRIVALSRIKGPLGAGVNDTIYKATTASGTVSLADLKTWVVGRGIDSDWLVSTASYFATGVKAQNPVALTNGGISGSGDDEAVRKLLTSFFSPSAKILGVLTFADLIALLDLADITNAIPVLREIVEYGSDAIGQELAGAADSLKTHVLLPLKSVVTKVRDQWAHLNDKIERQERKVTDTLNVGTLSTLQKLYPEIDAGLAALDSALDRSIAETDPLNLPTLLGQVYEIGRRFIHQLAELAANPAERLAEAARAVVEELTASVMELLYSELLSYEELLKDRAKEIADGLFGELVAQIQLLLPFSELKNLVDVYQGTTELVTLVQDVLKSLNPDSGDLDKLRAAATKAWFTVKNKGDSDKAAQAPIVLIFDLQSDRIKDAARKIDEFLAASHSDSTKMDARRVQAALRAYEQIIENVKAASKRGFLHLDGDFATVANAYELYDELRSSLRLMAALSSAEGRDQIRDAAVVLLKNWLMQVIAPDLAAIKTTLTQDLVAGLQSVALALDGQVKASGLFAPPNPEAVLLLGDAKPETIPAAAFAAAAKEAASSVNSYLQDFAGLIIEMNAADIKAQTMIIGDQLRSVDAPEIYQQWPKETNNALDGLSVIYVRCTLLADRLNAINKSVSGITTGKTAKDALWPALVSVSERLAHDTSQNVQDILQELQLVASYVRKYGDLAAVAGAIAILPGATPSLKSACDAVGKWVSGQERKIVAAVAGMVEAALGLLGSLSESTRSGGSEIAQRLANDIRGLPGNLNPQQEELAKAFEAIVQPMADLRIGVGAHFLNKPTTFGELAVSEIVIAAKSVPLAQMFQDGSVLGVGFVTRLSKFDTAADNVIKCAAAYGKRLIAVPAPIAKILDSGLTTVQSSLITLYDKIDKARNDIVGKLREYNLDSLSLAFWVRPKAGSCQTGDFRCDRLVEEETLLKDWSGSGAFSDDGSRAKLLAYLNAISGSGRDDGPALKFMAAQITEALEDVGRNLIRDQILSLIDIAAVRDEIEDTLSELMPLKRKFSYDLDYVFEGTSQIFQPQSGSHFTLSALATVDLIQQRVTASAKGALGPFDVKLIGDIFDALTVHFNGMTFVIEDGGKPQLNVDYAGFEIGEKLEFIKSLADYFSIGKSGEGFYIAPLSGIPGIEVGYLLPPMTLQLGPITFSNVSIDVSAALPFDGSAALFKAGLGTAFSPFLISMPPYGGGGFVAITADAHGIVGFEASLEFGGVVDFSVGPLQAFGSVRTGVYVRTMKLPGNVRITEIYGTFFAGGAASIWIFNFSASLYVRLQLAPEGGDMTGLAIFTFSFSMGFVHYNYRVSYAKTQKAPQSAAADIPQQTMFAGDGIDLDAMTTGAVDKDGKPSKPVIDITRPDAVRRTSCMSEHLNEFLDYFDLGPHYQGDNGCAQ
ncbi:hypothetical protein [Rhizobium leguminosarum]|uniref:hypothetical protein n=1 Tax=Rhizobium leguminosarum TaxID=384 RepID=UPI001C95002F|nr:hypothetical protein [Rhizobium leguminosarum]MBY5579144.1 hypothetical protein [Rhizobium leguminosarum]